MEAKFFTTAPNPRKRAHRHGMDQNQIGWRVHAVLPVDGDEVTQKYRPAACGLKPRHGWALDLFIDERCRNCERRMKHLGIEWAEWTAPRYVSSGKKMEAA